MNNVAKLLAMFAIAQILGLVVMSAFVQHDASDVFKYEQYSIDDLFFMLLGFAFTVIFLVILVTKYKGVLLYKIMEFIIVASATFVIFYGVGLHVGYDIGTAVALAVMLSTIKFFNPRIKNLTATVSSAGVAVMFATFFSFIDMIIFVIIMSVYDYVAVFVTKHMVLLASEFGARDISFSISAKEKVRKRVKAKYKGKVREFIQERTERLELGTGDIALPLAFNLVVFKFMAVQNIGAAISAFIVISTFSIISLAITLAFVKKRKLFLPALPPIMLGTVLGYILAYISGMV